MKLPVKMIPFQEDMLSFGLGGIIDTKYHGIPPIQVVGVAEVSLLDGLLPGRCLWGRLRWPVDLPGEPAKMASRRVYMPCKIDMGHEQTRTNQIEEMIGWYILARK